MLMFCSPPTPFLPSQFTADCISNKLNAISLADYRNCANSVGFRGLVPLFPNL